MLIYNVSTDQELSKFNLEGKWNDYIGVQKEVLHVLRQENFFDTMSVINFDSGMEIRILIEDDVANSHSENGYKYAFIGNRAIIDGVVVGIRIAIKKKVGSNHFWIHNIDEKSFELLSPSEETVLKETQSF